MLSPDKLCSARRCEILLVEDSAKDARLIREVLQEQGHPHHLHPARDGDEALHWLRGETPSLQHPSPDLSRPDINLPHLSGHANGYLVKPTHSDDFAGLIQRTLQFCLQYRVPPQQGAP